MNESVAVCKSMWGGTGWGCLMCEHVLGVWRVLGCLQLKPFFFSSGSDHVHRPAN